jgi:hypothetical protein
MCQVEHFVWFAHNVGSYTQVRIAGDFLSSRKLFERKDAHRKPPLPHLTGS